MTNNCEYCKEYNKNHVDGDEIASILSTLNPEVRAKLSIFIQQVANEHFFHTTHAVNRVKQICESCGERAYRLLEDDGDRYYYICDNPKCPVY